MGRHQRQVNVAMTAGGLYLAQGPDLLGAELAGGDLPPSPDLSIVVPCYNEEGVLAELYARVRGVCGRSGLSYEVVLVNDGSRDRTWAVMTELASVDGHLVLANLSRNHGHQLALTAGLSLARGRRVLILDADLQDPPELLPEMLQIMDAGADVVYGVRRRREGEAWPKRATAWLFYRVLGALSDVPIPCDTGDFRLLSRRALDALMAMPERHRFLRGMVSWIGLRQEPILYDRSPRAAGSSNYSWRKMARLAWDAVVTSSTRPLALPIWAGTLSCLLAALLLVRLVARGHNAGVTTGWAGPVAVVLMLGGVQLVTLGILGEYIGRLYEQSRNRPLFIVERIVNASKSAGSTDTTAGVGDRPGDN